MQQLSCSFFTSSDLRLPLFAALTAVSLLGKPGLAVGVQLLPDGDNCAVNPVFLQLAFPYYDDAPAERFQEGVIPQVALAVVLNLRAPELRICLRPGGISAILVPVPEAAVDEDACAVLRQDNVRGAGETFLVDAIPISESEQLLTQLHLRLSVLRPNV